MKAIEQYSPVAMRVMLCQVVLTFVPVDEILKCDRVTIQMKAIGQYIPVVLFIILYKLVLNF